jgi:predicted nucleotidyltransferase component of viral defense system
MKDYLKQILSSDRTLHRKRLVVREYLQARTLQMLQDSGVFLSWLFHGGTALRFLYSIPRFSEDLDFSSVKPSHQDDFSVILNSVKSKFEKENYSISLKLSDKKTVQSALIRFQGFLHELDLSGRPNENLSIKVEVDTEPPEGATWETTLVRRHVTLNLPHHDKASLLAGKVHAVLSRSFTKGRDLFDITWYLADRSWPEPNLEYLNNALMQTGWKGSKVNQGNWKTILKNHLENVDWEKARKDVAPFLERKEDIDLLTLENCLKLLEK